MKQDPQLATRPVQSMTGYGSASRDEPLPVHVELRGVNGRFLDLTVRMPDELRPFETVVRDRVRRAVERGKVECRITLDRDRAPQLDAPDPDVLARLVNHIEALRRAMPDTTPPSVTDLLTTPGLFARPIETETLRAPLLDALEEALGQFLEARRNEGDRLVRLLQTRLDAIDASARALSAAAPELLERFQTRLVERIEQALGLTEGADRIPAEEVMVRVRQEVAAYGLRTDTAEELDRLRSHVQEFHQRLEGSGPVGKRLDFLTQELNREANTLASKAAGLEIARAAVELKVLIEQIREQIQNLE